jgi:hypothetical protein
LIIHTLGCSLFTITFVVPIKTAQVRPLFKKKNILEKGNYRPVSVLPTISKFVERAIFDQLTFIY